ncbi:hypothetical protein [Microbispora sp. NPDC049125]|uniref:hypothetical protein n=1 Tax=Microbispora sp. NPDC049125 TaxID=3154929 RepID=UPI003465FBDC
MSDNAEGIETSAAGWTTGSGTFSRDTTRFRTGAASLKIVSAVIGDTFCYSNGNIAGIVAGTTYTLYSYVFTTLTGRTAKVGCDWKTSSNAFVSSFASSAVTLTANTWTLVGPFTAVAPATATQATAYVPWAVSSATSQSFWFDDLFFGIPPVTVQQGWGVPI